MQFNEQTDCAEEDGRCFESEDLNADESNTELEQQPHAVV